MALPSSRDIRLRASGADRGEHSADGDMAAMSRMRFCTRLPPPAVGVVGASPSPSPSARVVAGDAAIHSSPVMLISASAVDTSNSDVSPLASARSEMRLSTS